MITHEQLADALEYFQNAADVSLRRAMADSQSIDVINAIVEGVNAIAMRLREQSEEGEENLVEVPRGDPFIAYARGLTGKAFEPVAAAPGGMVAVSPESLEVLRDLRLDAWKEVQTFRKMENEFAGRGQLKGAECLRNLANEQLRIVQALNDFFPPGNTAESDER